MNTLKLIRCIPKRSLQGLRLMSSSSSNIIPVSEVKRFTVDCLEAAAVPQDHAVMLADVLVAADYRGHFSHGMNRLEMYVKDVQSGICDGGAEPAIIKQTAATALVDGKNGLGPVVGNFCMQLAINKALETGVGWIAAKGSNHYGIASWYSLQAVEKGMIGLSFTNTSPLMSPTRAKTPALGTNPLTLAAPGKNGDSFVLDMATTAVALGKLEVQRRKNEPLPHGWAQDETGTETTNAARAVTKGTLLPLGGTELTSGYKGYGLSFLVELLCGVLAGATYGPHIRRWMTTDRSADLGQCFIAVNPDAFAPGFTERLQDLMDYMRNLEPSDPSLPVLVAGDPERKCMAMNDKQGGIKYHESQLIACKALANTLSVIPLRPL
ncbi:uncharacterized oxidoreductase YjmC [Neocloeon triangulifer]|uniref:uncharacterized oxidoreductase YjmC n=1 Tax=Neocloeon triangulifer TaxID=2078957 RepID=UPI00286F075D|nr:uncharacterized oxidoreductase YjmC [Neocloeon triangulifer]XP_059477787.1 uncharacterized oxidoreductase YjmC [Neocloeon triangulifer]